MDRHAQYLKTEPVIFDQTLRVPCHRIFHGSVQQDEGAMQAAEWIVHVPQQEVESPQVVRCPGHVRDGEERVVPVIVRIEEDDTLPWSGQRLFCPRYRCELIHEGLT